MDMLDASTGVLVNGLEDDPVDWPNIDWRSVERDVRRLRQRIFTASGAGDLKKVRNLQKLMLRSRANALVATRRVAQLNQGRATAGIDGRTALLATQKAQLAAWAHTHAGTWSPRPVKRVYIPKANGKRRPLGIPVLRDRVLQAMVLNALEPEWEARFEPRSYGFRPGRGCHDAIQAIYLTLKGPLAKRLWVLDADLAAAFDRIDHDVLLAQLGTFPARETVRAWLKAGVMEAGRYAPTPEGTPQGGVISPLLLNVALHGMEHAVGIRYIRRNMLRAPVTAPGCPVVVRYADDLVALCHTREQAEQVKAKLAAWLAPRGLAFNEDKTRIVHIEEGFDFLGFNARRYKGGRLLIKPSKTAVNRFRERLRTEVRALRGADEIALIAKLNPILRGWAAYYRIGVSKQIFSTLDHYLWWTLLRWGLRRHANKSKKWVLARYFGRFHPTRTDRWIFGDRASGYHLIKMAWTPIVRHEIVRGNASPDDPALADYWAARRRRRTPPLTPSELATLKYQRGRCPLCGELLLYADDEPQSPDQWAQWLTATRKAIRRQVITATSPGRTHDRTASQLVHARCATRHAEPHGSPPPRASPSPSQ